MINLSGDTDRDRNELMNNELKEYYRGRKKDEEKMNNSSRRREAALFFTVRGISRINTQDTPHNLAIFNSERGHQQHH